MLKLVTAFCQHVPLAKTKLTMVLVSRKEKDQIMVWDLSWFLMQSLECASWQLDWPWLKVIIISKENSNMNDSYLDKLYNTIEDQYTNIVNLYAYTCACACINIHTHTYISMFTLQKKEEEISMFIHAHLWTLQYTCIFINNICRYTQQSQSCYVFACNVMHS